MIKYPNVNKYPRIKHRPQNFEQHDWNSSILVFGCSMVYGEGVEVKDTLPSQLEIKTNIPCINLGVQGASPMYIWSDIADVLYQGITPKAIVVVWTHPNRLITYSGINTRNLTNTALGSNVITPLATEWILHEHQGPEFLARAIISSRVMCKDIPYFEYTWVKNQLDLFDLSRYNCDLATDNIHPGPLSYTKWAEHIANDIKCRIT